MSNVPKATIELDDDYPQQSMADAAVADGVEDEKCVVAQYRTTLDQKQEFKRLLNSSSREDIPIEWVIDIADESNGWFYATAYGYNDITNMLHVMVPDKLNPTFDGEVQLDHRTVHLIECVDGKSMALFNKIIRESVLKIKWDVEWYEEEANEYGEPIEGAGAWVKSSARYYIRIANQLLVEDKDMGQETRGFVIITADMNVKLLECYKGKGVEDFNRLVLESVVQSSDEAFRAAESGSNIPPEDDSSPRETSPRERERDRSDRDREKDRGDRDRGDRDRDRESRDRSGGSSGISMRKLAEYARNVRESVNDIIEEREQKKSEDNQLASLFHSFVVDGELDHGLQLMHHFDKIRNKDKSNIDEDEERLETTLEDAKMTSTKLEKAILKILKSGAEDKHGDGDEKLQQKIKKLEKEINDLKRR